MPFPILRTPLVVLSEVISLLEPNEIVTTSFCSEKVKRLLKRHYQQRKPSEWILGMSACELYGSVDIGTLSDNLRKHVLSAKQISVLDESQHKLVETNEYKRGFSSRSYPVLYFDDRVMGAKMVLDYASDLFNLDIYGLEIDRSGFWAIDWINNRQEKMLVHFEFNNNYSNWDGDEAMDHVLRNVRASDCYVFKNIVSDSFRFDGKLGPAYHLLINSNGNWVTLNNLMNFDFMKIIIEKSRFFASDVYSFLRHWRAGGSPRLTFLMLTFETDRHFENFEEELEFVEEGIVEQYRLSDGKIVQLRNGYSIQGMDGVKAVVHFQIHNFVMKTVMYLDETKALYIAKGGFDLPIDIGCILLILFLVFVVTSCTGPAVQYLQVTHLLCSPVQKTHSVLRTIITLIPLFVAIPTVILVFNGYVPNEYEKEISKEMILVVTGKNDTSFLMAAEEKIYDNSSGTFEYDIPARICTGFIFSAMFLSLIVVIVGFIKMQITMKKKTSISNQKSQKQLNLLLFVQFIFPFITIHIPFYVAFILPFADIEFSNLSSKLPYMFAWCPAINPMLVICMIKSIRDKLLNRKGTPVTGTTLTTSTHIFHVRSNTQVMK
ncbi:hypothetical protein B9Z55_013260 [Caenorhabditis nigoni]|uniref:F-box domain-containing protein n=1 Tax=Caenorhabditis nigoni TaxID=1611254 RepID=A0A2G5U0V2_9PELO|nr:hypothetical protein B9Z55_013260 [Caenorhabditis nigoni]